MALNRASSYACFQEPQPSRSPPLSDSRSNPGCPQIMLVFDLLSLALRKLTHSEAKFSTSTPWISRFPCQDQIHTSNTASSFLVQTCPAKPSPHYTSFLFYSWLLGLDSTIYPTFKKRNAKYPPSHKLELLEVSGKAHPAESRVTQWSWEPVLPVYVTTLLYTFGVRVGMEPGLCAKQALYHVATSQNAILFFNYLFDQLFIIYLLCIYAWIHATCACGDQRTALRS